MYLYPFHTKHTPLPLFHTPNTTQTHVDEWRQHTQIHHSQDKLILLLKQFDSKDFHTESPPRLWDVLYAIRAFDFRRREGSRDPVGEGAISHIFTTPKQILTLLDPSNFYSTQPSQFSVLQERPMASQVLKETKSQSAAEVVVETETAVWSVKCCCCGLVEECTQAYIGRVRERYGGRWICGLCSEAVKEEREREREKIVITTEEALKRHMRFCEQFKSSTPPDSTNDDFILAVKQILFRTLDSPRKDRFICRPLGRSHSCFSTMHQGETAD